MEKEIIYDITPKSPCEECPYASWQDYDGVLFYGCDMSHCYLADEEYDSF